MTVGGAVMGAALESSSHRHGQFSDACAYLTLLLGNGTVVECSPTRFPELFAAVPGSYGTLALLLKAGVELEPCSPRVRITYRAYEDVDAGIAALLKACGDGDICVRGGGGRGRGGLAQDRPVETVEGGSGTAVGGATSCGGADGGDGIAADGGQYEAVAAPTARARGAPAFVEALHLPKGPVVVMTGDYYDGSGGNAEVEVRLEMAWGLWFYERVGRIAGRLLRPAAQIDGAVANRAGGSQDCSSSSSSSSGYCGGSGNGGGSVAAHTEVVPTYDFIFRYDRGAFWMARPMAFAWRDVTLSTAPLFLATDPNSLSRFLFRWFFTAERLYKLLHLASPKAVAETMLAHDFYVPADRAADLVRFVRGSVPISTPLWLCPVRGPAGCPQPLSPHGVLPPESSGAASDFGGGGDKNGGGGSGGGSGKYGGGVCGGRLLVNVGVYGRVSDRRGEEHSRRLEAWLRHAGGRKMLYSQNFFSKKDFWEEYDDGSYRRLRAAVGAEDVFPDIYEKTCIGERGWPEDDPAASQGLRWRYRLSRLLL
ncbi:unnamed protein product [Phaeothamnion confervicola]